MTDSYIQVPTDSTGKKVATTERTNANGDTVELQQLVVVSPTTSGFVAEVTPTAEQKVREGSDMMAQILLELRMIRLAVSAIACSGNQATPEDFDPNLTLADGHNTII